jgi:uncharacterized protein with FMN-binding domain
MATKMPRRLVALSAAAIATVYAAGYATTQGADSRLAASELTPIAALSVPAAPASVPTMTTTVPIVSAPATPTSVPAPASVPRQATPTIAAPSTAQNTATATTVAYRDGTYEGQGTSRRGGFRVAVTIQGGKITNVAITQATTQYPASRVAALPGQVVARQSAQVDRVTGATFSTQAFQQAVQQALTAASTSRPAATAADTTANGQGA